MVAGGGDLPVNTSVDRSQPHNAETERAFLGGLILAGGDGPDLNPGDFYLQPGRPLLQGNDPGP